MTKHSPATPLPWGTEKAIHTLDNSERIYAEDPGPEYDFNVAFVRDLEDSRRIQNAAFIVHAANAYGPLVAIADVLASLIDDHGALIRPSLEEVNQARALLRSLGEAE